MPQLPVLITMPHASGYVPFDILEAMLRDDVHSFKLREARLRHLHDESDPYTDRIFHAPGATHLPARASRFVVDLNRSRSDAGPNGTIKLTDFGGEPLYPSRFRLTAGAAEERLARYWDPYHQAIEAILKREDIHFFIDGHAMSPTGPVLGPDEGKPRPALCIITGGDMKGEPLDPERHTSIPPKVAQHVAKTLETHFRPILTDATNVPPEVRINDPFTVGFIQQHYSNPNLPYAKPGFAIEINRALYLQVGEDGLEQDIPGRVEALNEAFRAFLQDIVPLFP